MKVTVLGNRSPYPTKNSGCSGYLIQHENKNILVDLGPNTLQNLQKIIPCYQVDVLIISHLHLDHFLDLLPFHYAVMLAMKKGYRQDALAVYLPFTEGSELDFIKTKVGDEFYLEELTTDSKLSCGELEFVFHPTTHSKECFGIKVKGPNSTLAYTADTALDNNLIQFFKGSDFLLAEASLLEQDGERRSSGHMTVKDAVEFGTKAEVGKLLLTHLGSVYQIEDIKAEIPETDFDVELSEVLKTYSIS